jgi:cytosine/adenosine deaminase-related metal-dependent hydrolase
MGMERPLDERPARAAVDLLVRHGRLVTMDDDRRVVGDGAVAIVDGRIVDIGPDRDVIARAGPTSRTIDAAGAPVHPGLVDGHIHASFQLLRGVHADHAIEDDILDAFYLPWFDLVTDEEEHLGVLLACLEMVRNGTTCFLEAGTVLEPEAAANAIARVGMRASLGDPFIWDQPQAISQGKGSARTVADGADRPLVRRAPRDLDEALARLGEQLGRNADPDALVTGHVCVNGLGTASEALLVEAKRRADAAGTIMDMHHAYSVADTAADRERYGRDPLVHLADAGVLGRNVTLAHANHLTDVECDRIVELGTSLVWAPAASMVWGHGGTLHGRHAELFRRGANVALGSDSANWSNDFDLFRQADLALLTARDAHEDRTYLGADDVLWMATRGGARAAGLEDRVGSLEVGKRADLVIHGLRPELVPAPNVVRGLMQASRSKAVRTVIVDGRVVLDDGVFPHLDEAALLARIDEAASAMLRRLEATGVAA